MAIQKTFLLADKPLVSGKSYYAAIYNSSEISEPLRSAIRGEATPGAIWNFTSGEFDDSPDVICSDASAWAQHVTALSEVNASQCGGIYELAIPLKLQQPGLNLEVVTFEQTGSSPSWTADSIASLSNHYTGDVSFSCSIRAVAGVDDDNLRLIAVFDQDGRLKDVSSATFSVQGPASLNGTVFNPQAGVYYQDVSLSNVSQGAFIRADVSGDIQCGSYQNSAWSNTGVSAQRLESATVFAKGSNVGSALNSINSRPIVTS